MGLASTEGWSASGPVSSSSAEALSLRLVFVLGGLVVHIP